MTDVQQGLLVTPETIDQYIASLKTKGRAAGTIQTYRHSITMLYHSLPASNKRIYEDTLQEWQQELVERGYSARTINTNISAANSFLEYYGYRYLQLASKMAPAEEEPPEMKRSEYLRLLSAARLLGKERLYLMIKLFATTGLTVQELQKVTVSGVREGSIRVTPNGTVQQIRIPSCLQGEMLAYIQEQNIKSGPVFITRNGTPLSRSNVSDSIRNLCTAAQVAPEKGNPRCLRKLYLETRRGIMARLEALAEQTYTQLLEEEQRTISWDESGESHKLGDSAETSTQQRALRAGVCAPKAAVSTNPA